jgi:phosphoglycolate phosphatase-like HAD superfamily hydrolase
MDDVTLDLEGFTDVTDTAILHAWCVERLGRPPRGEEESAVRARFLELLTTAAGETPSAFEPLPGVSAWLAARPRGSVAIATGGWGHTARFKLARAGLAALELPLASSDDAATRPGIMRAARARLDPAHRATRPIYLGDGPWDVAAARELRWDFIGVASGERAARLRDAGASRVVANFLALGD